MGPDATFGQLLHRVTLDREHGVDTWRCPDGSVFVLLVNRQGEVVQRATVPRLLRWSKYARRCYRGVVVRRWVLTPDDAPPVLDAPHRIPQAGHLAREHGQ
ncbi:hypothetical protein ACIPSA_35515 [Streptomyces sp. NPDC086549]|uniref:hypothetical protein n=1 Tax=Streptomyces sp. NPDC086549 TaxID=3365752 RepID=UPI00381882EF